MSSRLSPYINFPDGQARAALEFYQGVLGGDLTLSTFGQFGASDPADTDKIMHGQLETPAGYLIMGADIPKHMEAPGGANSTVSLSLSGDDLELRGYWDGLGEGGTVTLPLEKQVWGDEFGMLTDRFGTQWMVNIVQNQG